MTAISTSRTRPMPFYSLDEGNGPFLLYRNPEQRPAREERVINPTEPYVIGFVPENGSVNSPPIGSPGCDRSVYSDSLKMHRPHRELILSRRHPFRGDLSGRAPQEVTAFLGDYYEQDVHVVQIWQYNDARRGSPVWQFFFDWDGTPRASITPLHSEQRLTRPELRRVNWGIYVDLDKEEQIRAEPWTAVDGGMVRLGRMPAPGSAELTLARVYEHAEVRISESYTDLPESGAWLTGPAYDGTPGSLAQAQAWCGARLYELGAVLED